PTRDGMEEFKDNSLVVDGRLTALEKVYDYEPGRHHPVHLGDLLNKRYEVIHKLGSGGYANVWLCCDDTSDVPQFAAVKIIMAEESTYDCPELRVNKLKALGLDEGPLAEHFCLPQDKFDISGPNGQHYAFVYPVLGPRVSRLLNVVRFRDPERILRELSLQTAKAMAALHLGGICHGDFRPANILARISGLDGLSKHDILQALGQPKTTKVTTRSGENHNEPIAPQYLVYPISWDDVELSALGESFITDKACVIDFGESFDISEPPQDIGIPQIYCSPEYTVDKVVGVGSDIWALGCTLFEIRTGRKLFDTFDDDQDEYLCKMVMMLGKLPETWWSTTWEARKLFFEDNVDGDGCVVEIRRELLQPDTGDREVGCEASVVQVPEPRSIKDAIIPGLFYENRYGPGGVRHDISQEETDLLSDLLMKIFRYNPKERLTASQVVDHAWFKL
ncbi:Serine/threonine-protein kinase SRPK, partial [Lachnellula arida]